MLCGWLSSSVAQLVVNSMPPTFSSTRSDKQVATGGQAAWRVLVEGCSWGGDPAAAAAAAVVRRGALRGGCCRFHLFLRSAHVLLQGHSPLMPGGRYAFTQIVRGQHHHRQQGSG